MIVGAKFLTWAPVTGGGAGAAVTYSGGALETDKLVKVDMSEERADTGFYADDHRIDRDNSITGATVSVEAAQLTADMRQGMLGHTVSSSTYTVTDAASPYVGVGFCLKNRYKGAVTYRCYWYHKVQFSEGQRSFNTKGENIEFQTESLEGDAEAVQLTENGAFEYYQYTEAASEAAAQTWLKGKGSVT